MSTPDSNTGSAPKKPDTPDRTDRRSFLRTLVTGGCGVAIGATGLSCSADHADAPSGPRVPVLTADGRVIHVDASTAVEVEHSPANRRQVGIPGRQWVMVIDLAKCGGARECVKACGKMHHTAPGREWITVFEMQDSPEEAPYWFPKPCFHCDNPPCTKVCPVGATYKRSDGIVAIDNDRCIGCRFCMAACPYSTRVFNWGAPAERPAAADSDDHCPNTRQIGTVEKCDFCADRSSQGILPDCVTACPNGAIYFGDENEDAVTNSQGDTERLSNLLRERAGYRHLEELGTHPRVFYLPPKNRLLPAPDEARATRAAATHS